MNTERPVVISFFDYTAIAVRDWAEEGYEVHCFDLQHSNRLDLIERTPNGGSVHYRHADLSADSHAWGQIVAEFAQRNVVMVFGFPPCTDLAVSGARHFAAKAAADPLFQVKAVAMAKRCAWAADALGAPYCIENPVSVLSTLWRKPDHTFNPCEYGGYLPNEPHPIWPDYIPARDAYTKRTCLWTGNGFVMPVIAPVAPVMVEYIKGNGKVTRGSPQFGKLGGKSLKTKNIRNATPRGFALAAFLANHLPIDLAVAA